MAGRAPRGALCHCPHRVCTLKQTSSTARRAFSSSESRRRKGSLETFLSTSNPTLAELFTTVRDKIFIPAHLKHPQKNLIYRQKFRSLLLNDPFIIEVGDNQRSEEIQLLPIDRTKDVPDSWKSMVQAMRLMSNPASSEPPSKKGRKNQQAEEFEAADESAQPLAQHEWKNLIPLLKGMRVAGRKWKTWQWEYIIRTAGEAGAAPVIIEAARQAAKTGLYLNDVRLVRQLLWACRATATGDGKDAQWELANTTKALSLAENLARLMDDKKHEDFANKEANRLGLNKTGVEVMHEVHTQVDVIGPVLELAAVRAEILSTASSDGAADAVTLQDARDKVVTYVQRIIPNLSRAEGGLADGANAGLLAMTADYELQRWVPVWHGLRKAQAVLGSELPNADAVPRAISQLETTIRECSQVVRDNSTTAAAADGTEVKRRGMRWLEAAGEL